MEWDRRANLTLREVQGDAFGAILGAMSNEPKKGLKTAYELALERMEKQGIERPRENSLSDAERQQVAEIRSKTTAKLAELEILHRDSLTRSHDPHQRQEAEEEYVRERRRLEEKRDAEIAALRQRKS